MLLWYLFQGWMAAVGIFLAIACLIAGLVDWWDMAEDWCYERKAQKSL